MVAPPTIFDRAAIARNLARRPGGAEDFVTALMLDDLGQRLATVSRGFAKALMLSPDGRLPETGTSASGPIRFERAATLLANPAMPVVDPERLVLPSPPYDLIVSVGDMQVVNDVPGFLARVRAQLAPDGLFLAAVLGGESLKELRQAFLVADAELSGGAFARIAPMIEVRDAGGLLQRAGFALPVADVETHIVRYGSPLALMRDIKALGAANPLAERPARVMTPRLLARAALAYHELAGDPDGRVRATLDIVWLSGWAPHESQQKPLVPGSAEVSLARVLGKKQ